MNVLIKSRKLSKKEIKRWRSVGFKVLKNRTNKIVLEIPRNWKLIPVEGETEIKQFLDANNKIRGVYTPIYAYLYCRYEIVSVEKSKKDHICSAETYRLYVIDRKTNQCVYNLGGFEPYSDYERDLISLAKMWLNTHFPHWKDEAYYWDD